MTERAGWALLAVAWAGCGGASTAATVTSVADPPVGATTTDLGSGTRPVATADGGLPIPQPDGGVTSDAGSGSGSDCGGVSGDLGPPAGDMTAGTPTWHVEPSGVPGDLVGVYALAHDAWAVGPAGTLLHTSGDGSWTALTTADSNDFTAVWGEGPTDLFVTDAAGATLHSSDGATFTAVGSTAAKPTSLFGGGDVIYVNTSGPPGPQLYRSLDRGATFAPMTITASGFPGALTVTDNAMWGDASSLFGASCIVQTNCQAFHSEDGGASWSLFPMPSGAGTVHADYFSSFAVGDRFYVLYQLSPPISQPGPNRSTIMVSTDRGQTFATGSSMLGAVGKFWVAKSGDIVAVGQAGLVGQGKGAAFAPIAVPTTADLNAVWGSAADDVYIVGNGGVILHFRR